MEYLNRKNNVKIINESLKRTMIMSVNRLAFTEANAYRFQVRWYIVVQIVLVEQSLEFTEGIMFVTNLEIEHFRGIQKGNISFSLDSRVICMIGAGDSTKSTVIKAIEWVFWPSWNLIACDNDFYGCDTSVPIIIRGTFKEIPSQLITEEKFGR